MIDIVDYVNDNYVLIERKKGFGVVRGEHYVDPDHIIETAEGGNGWLTAGVEGNVKSMRVFRLPHNIASQRPVPWFVNSLKLSSIAPERVAEPRALIYEGSNLGSMVKSAPAYLVIENLGEAIGNDFRDLSHDQKVIFFGGLGTLLDEFETGVEFPLNFGPHSIVCLDGGVGDPALVLARDLSQGCKIDYSLMLQRGAFRKTYGEFLEEGELEEFEPLVFGK